MKAIGTLLLVLVINLIAFSQNLPTYLPSYGLVGWWPFNGNANDESGNSYNGNVSGAQLSSDRIGDTNSAYYFDGISNFISFGTIIDFSRLESTTISAWFKPQEFYSYINTYTGVDIGTKILGHITLRVNAQERFQCMHSEASPPGAHQEYVIADSVYNYNQWYHVVGVYENNEAHLYVNGVEQTNLTNTGGLLSMIPANSELYVGLSYTDNNTPHYFVGYLDDIGIWNRALTYSEILDLYNSLGAVDAETYSSDLLKIYPNPFSGEVWIDLGVFSNKPRLSYSVTSVLGKHICEGELTNPISKITFGNSLPDGLYFISIRSKDCQLVERKKLLKLRL